MHRSFPTVPPSSERLFDRTKEFVLAPGSHQARAERGFTLVEMLVVMGIIVILIGLVVPSFTQVGTSQGLTKSTYDISTTLEEARAYAKANSTYTWVGFFEENTNGNAGVSGKGRIIASVVASKDGTSIYNNLSTVPDFLDSTRLTQLGKLIKVENVDLATLNSSQATDPSTVPSRAKVIDSKGNPMDVPEDYLMGNDKFASHADGSTGKPALKYPLTGTTQYTFTKIIQFTPFGDASKIDDTPYQLMEIDLKQTRGNNVDANSKNVAAIQISGIGGAVRIYRP